MEPSPYEWEWNGRSASETSNADDGSWQNNTAVAGHQPGQQTVTIITRRLWIAGRQQKVLNSKQASKLLLQTTLSGASWTGRA
jgi:hypothetical protein